MPDGLGDVVVDFVGSGSFVGSFVGNLVGSFVGTLVGVFFGTGTPVDDFGEGTGTGVDVCPPPGCL